MRLTLWLRTDIVAAEVRSGAVVVDRIDLRRQERTSGYS